MRRVLSLVALLSVLGIAAPHARAEILPVLDGKNLKQVVLTHDATRGASGTDPSDAQVLSCADPACGRLDFRYQPARGVTADLGVTVHWFYPVASDVDLYLVTGNQIVGRCAAQTGNTRHFTVPRTALKPGTKYTAVMFYSHSFGEKAKLVVSLPAQPTPATTVPPNLDDTEVVSCTT